MPGPSRYSPSGPENVPVRELADRITSGDISTHPYRKTTDTPCGFCDFRPLCRFDWKINEYNFIESVTKSDLLDLAGGDHA